MQGFIARSIPIVLRRLITMTPALIVLRVGLNPSRSLVISQVVLSFGIPFAARAAGAPHAPPGHHGLARQSQADDGRRRRSWPRSSSRSTSSSSSTRSSASARRG
jgi:hypothetical protein